VHPLGSYLAKDRVWALVGVALGVAYLFGPSAVPLDLWIIAGGWANIVVVLWVANLSLIAWRPCLAKLHIAAAALGILVFGGRGGGFLALIVSDGRHNLWVAFGERIVLGVIVVLWHWRAVRMIELLRLVDLYRAHLLRLRVGFDARGRPVESGPHE